MSQTIVVRWAPWVMRSELLAWLLVALIVVAFGANPYAAAASPLALHGALQNNDGIGIIAHRGAAATAPENTLAAARVGIEQGVEFLEVDVQLTADGVPVLMHDPLVDRTTNGWGRVAQLTLAEVHSLDAGSWFSAEFAGEPVPTLEQFVDEIDGTPARALVELKGAWSPARLRHTIDMLRSKGMVNRVALQSFEAEMLEAMRAEAPEFALILLTREWNAGVVDRAAELQVSAIGARTKLFYARPELMDRAQSLGIGTLAYTLNTEKRWATAVENGVDFVVTDDPIGLAQWRKA